MPSATITSKGQITIPVDIRTMLGLHTGDRINFITNDAGLVSFVPATKNVTSLKGLIAKPTESVSIEDMKNAVKVKGSQL